MVDARFLHRRGILVNVKEEGTFACFLLQRRLVLLAKWRASGRVPVPKVLCHVFDFVMRFEISESR